MRKTKYYFGKRKLGLTRGERWPYTLGSGWSVPRMFREYYLLRMHFAWSELRAKINTNFSFGKLGTAHEALEKGENAAASQYIQDNLAQRKQYKRAAIGKMSIPDMRALKAGEEECLVSI